MSPSEPRAIAGVLHHSRLERRGGTARVADLLCQGYNDAGLPSARSFEAVQSAQGEAWLAARGGDWRQALQAAVDQGWLIHLHGGGDVAALLEWLLSLQSGAPPALAVTLHDLSLLTGGCLTPEGCPLHAEGCLGVCPRGMPDAATRRRRNAEALRAASPLVFCPSRWGKEHAGRILPDLPVHLVPNGVPWTPRRPDAVEARRKAGLAPGARLVCFVAHGGQAAGCKAGETWPEIWRRIKTRVPDAVAMFIGGGETRREGDLLVWPWLEPEALAENLAAADVLVYPTWFDNHPLILLEAMAQGAVVAAWAMGGIPEIVRHAGLGLLAPPGDVAGLAEAAVRLLEQPALRREMANAAWDLGRRAFAAPRMVQDHLRLLHRWFCMQPPL